MTGHELQDTHDHRLGDKIRIRSGPYQGQRGIVQAASGDALRVLLDNASSIQVIVGVVTNYSRAARRAWETIPKRAGRPKNSQPRKKMVSMRLDPDIWDRLGKAVEAGLIPNREAAVNLWIREQLDDLFADTNQSSHITPNGGNDGPPFES